jgi:hypothetical protein
MTFDCKAFAWMTFARKTFERKKLLGKCCYGQTSSGKMFVGKFSLWENVFKANVGEGQCPLEFFFQANTAAGKKRANIFWAMSSGK